MRRLSRLCVFGTALTLLMAMAGTAAPAQGATTEAEPGAPGIGDPYFPLDGNGGYDVARYLIDVAYRPATDHLDGVTTITARARQELSSFHLDFLGLNVRSITVDGAAATWSRDGGELTVVPPSVIRTNKRFVTVVTYDGVPKTLDDPILGIGGAIHTDDGVMILGQPHVAATWFPSNDHPSDKATYQINLTVPNGLEAVSNGVLREQDTLGATTTWRWREDAPMATYLAMAAIGQFDVSAYTADGTQFWDALDPDLFYVPEPPDGRQYALSQQANDGASYKRLARTMSVPAGADDAGMSFWISRNTERNWDYAFVEVHTVGQNDWTTLPDRNGHTSSEVGRSCPYWLGLHPFLKHYQTKQGDSCTSSGTTGDWWAASGTADGPERWSVDLSAYAGEDIEVSITYASDDAVQALGVFVDDIVVSFDAGSTSFEDDDDPMDGWTVPGSPVGSDPNPNDWILGTAADAPETTGDIAQGSFDRHGEILRFLEGVAGKYPFPAAGGIVDDVDTLGYALEDQTRPIYSKDFFYDSVSGDSVLVHELAHQWYGDSLAVRRWRHIWLNEGFASYAEWLWSDHEGLGSPQEIFDFYYANIPPADPFWTLRIGNPGADDLFSSPVYTRGAMTLQALRVTIGDDDFFHILKRWPRTREGGNVATKSFRRLAERISGQQLDDFFLAWLFTPEKPALGAVDPGVDVPTTWLDAPAAARVMRERLRLQGVQT